MHWAKGPLYGIMEADTAFYIWYIFYILQVRSAMGVGGLVVKLAVAKGGAKLYPPNLG